jgi:hypothetical protein
VESNKLHVMVCLPCDEMPADERFIVVRASDGTRTQFIKFGRHTSIKTIWDKTPINFMDREYDLRRSKKKAV